MFLDQNLSCVLLKLKDLGDGFCDRGGETAALFQRPASGNMNYNKRHEILRCLALL
jgi:hypothetical protein